MAIDACMKTLKQSQWTDGRPSEKWTPWMVDYSCWGSIFHIFFLKSSDSLQKTVQLEDKLWLENLTYHTEHALWSIMNTNNDALTE